MITHGTDPDPARARRKRQGEMIRKLRKLNDLSIAEFAEAVDVTVGAVSQWETGRYTPRLAVQARIAKTLKVPHSMLFGLDSEAA